MQRLHCQVTDWARVGITLTLAACFLLGCSSKPAVETGSVSGQVTHHGGKPLANATIYFTSPQKGVETSVDLGPDGKYQFLSPLKAGNYQIQIIPPLKPGARPGESENLDIPHKARSYATSKLSATIKSGENKCDFELGP